MGPRFLAELPWPQECEPAKLQPEQLSPGTPTEFEVGRQVSPANSQPHFMPSDKEQSGKVIPPPKSSHRELVKDLPRTETNLSSLFAMRLREK